MDQATKQTSDVNKNEGTALGSGLAKNERLRLADDGPPNILPTTKTKRQTPFSKKDGSAKIDAGLELASITFPEGRSSRISFSKAKLGQEDQHSDFFPGAVRVAGSIPSPSSSSIDHPLVRSDGVTEPHIHEPLQTEQLFRATLVDRNADERSLPYAEATTLPTTNESRRKRLWLGGILLAVAVVVAIAVVASRRPAGGDSPPPTTTDLLPTIFPTGPPSNAPSLSRISVVQAIVASFSPDGTLPSAGSPQAAAMNWLLDDDGNSAVELSDTERLTTRYALAVLYFSTDGANWVDTLNFLTSNHECDWRSVITSVGIECDSNRQVVSVNLPNNRLDGPVPPEIRLLTRLTRLNLRGDWQDGGVVNVSSNFINGTIPTEIGELKFLIQLDLSSNGLLTGVIPTEIVQLTNLVEIRLNDDGLTGAAIPTDIGIMPSLTYVSLSNNFITGIVPESLLENIRCVLLDGNNNVSCPFFRRRLQAFSNRATCSTFTPPCGLS